MKTSTIVISIFLFFFLYACNFYISMDSKTTDNKDTNAVENKDTIRIIVPKTDDERISNLLIDINTYEKYNMEFNNKGIINMTKPEFVEKAGGKSEMLKSLEDFKKRIHEGNEKYLSVNISLPNTGLNNKMFLTINNTIIAIAIKKTVSYTTDINTTMSYNKTLIAESKDNGVNWKFVDVSHLEYFGIEQIYSKNDYELIKEYLPK